MSFTSSGFLLFCPLQSCHCRKFEHPLQVFFSFGRALDKISCTNSSGNLCSLKIFNWFLQNNDFLKQGNIRAWNSATVYRWLILRKEQNWHPINLNSWNLEMGSFWLSEVTSVKTGSRFEARSVHFDLLYYFTQQKDIWIILILLIFMWNKGL